MRQNQRRQLLPFCASKGKCLARPGLVAVLNGLKLTLPVLECARQFRSTTWRQARWS